MSRRDRARILTEIVAVRQVQERAAKMAVGRANAELEALGQARSVADDRLEQDQRRWTAAMAGPGLDPGLAGAWSAAVLRAEGEVRDVDVRIGQAEAQKARRSDDWRIALSRADLAADLAGKARRARDRADEEAALADLTDRIAHRGQQP